MPIHRRQYGLSALTAQEGEGIGTDRLLCSRNAHHQNVLVRCAQLRAALVAPLKNDEKSSRDTRNTRHEKNRIATAARPSFLLAEAARSECAPSMRAMKDSLAASLTANWRKSNAVLAVLTWDASLTHVQKLMTNPMLENGDMKESERLLGYATTERCGLTAYFCR